MNAPTITPPTAPPAISDGGMRIAMGFNFPIATFPEGHALHLDSPAVFLPVIRGLQFALERAGLISDGLRAAGDFCNGWLELKTSQPKAALELIHAWRATGPLLRGFSCVGWYCEAEEDWRLTAHGAVPIQLSEFLRPEPVAERDALMQQTVTLLENIVASIESRLPPPQ